MGIEVRPVESNEELGKANAVIALVHGDSEFDAAHWLDTCGRSYPGHLREHTRIAVSGGEVVGGLRLTTDTVKIGEARLKMGGIGWVSTAPQHRRKGICRLLMEDILRYMKHHKYHVSMLFGIPGFYHKWDYVTAMADYCIDVDTVEALTFDCPLQARRAKPGDIPAVQKLHALNDGEVACSLVRTAAHYSCKWEHCGGMHVLTDEKGKVVAYFNAKGRGDHLAVDEVAVAEVGLCAGVLKACGEMAEEESLALIRIAAPPRHPMARYMLGFKSRHEMQVSRDANGMLAFVNIEDSLEHMIPEWERLLSTSAIKDTRTEVTVLVGQSVFRIRANRGAVDIACVPGKNKVALSRGELIQLLTGYVYVEDALFTKHCLLSPDARVLCQSVFPKRTPFVWPFDRF